MYKNTFLRIVNSLQDTVRDFSFFAKRPAVDSLHGYVSETGKLGKIFSRRDQCLAHHKPINKKNRLQSLHPFTFDTRMSIAPNSPFKALDIPVGNVHATHITDLAVNDNNLSMIPVIQSRGNFGQCCFEKRFYFDAGLTQFLKECLFRFARTKTIVNNPYFNAFERFFNQCIPDFCAYFIISKYIIFHVDMLFGLFNVAKQVFEFIYGIGIKPDIVSTEQRSMVKIFQQTD
ncbi:hypothetical protein SDC9_97162 [bioreactor metagenome]|uniref:Uncharacterized protein n=1 Tax=bioreactor metagenome TaxID=1076179 RepID=A0A645AHU1_9ZZZZ